MPARVCLRCGQITTRPTPRGLCSDCQAAYEQARPARAVYDDPRWRRLTGAVVRDWVRHRGWRCPGHGRPAHPAIDLTADHRIPLADLMAAGVNVWDRNNLGVLCRSCNGRKAATTPATRRI